MNSFCLSIHFVDEQLVHSESPCKVNTVCNNFHCDNKHAVHLVNHWTFLFWSVSCENSLCVCPTVVRYIPEHGVFLVENLIKIRCYKCDCKFCWQFYDSPVLSKLAFRVVQKSGM